MKLPLVDGAYQSKSIISSAQRCINLYAEKNPEDSPFPSTHYLTPGTDLLIPGPSVNAARCTYRTSNGDLYAVIGATIYYVPPNFVLVSVGTIDAGETTVSMQDNGLVILIADGTANLYAIDLSTRAFAQVTDPNIYGGDRVDYLDTFFLLNIPNTNQWYISLSEVNFQMLTGSVGSILTGSITDPGDLGAIASGSITNAGSTYVNGSYSNVPLIGGSGNGASANITVSGNIVTVTSIVVPGIDYVVGDILTVNASSIGGTGSGFTYTVASTQGTYTDGTYLGVALTGGTGSGATADIVISNKVIVSVTLDNPGLGYLIGDVLSASDASIGGTGTGFVYTVGTIGGGAFDPLDVATKNGYPDAIQSLIVMHREIWIIGTLTSEIWYDSGAADFVFQILPGTFIEHGCIAKYSICKQDLSVYWLSQDEQGQTIVIRGNNYQASRISTFAIENEFSTYSTISDAIGCTYQQEGHTFYVLMFPTANKTWVFDQSNETWHERCWTDNQGNLNRHRMNCCTNAYNQNIIGDWQNGNIYALNLNTTVDNVDGLGSNPDGSYPISRMRSWPALVNEGKRVSYKQFIADMQVGDDLGNIDNASSINLPYVSLRWSDDRGRTYGNKLEQSLGAIGQYLTNISWNRLGMGRGRVWELSWSVPGPTALNGCYIEVEPAAS